MHFWNLGSFWDLFQLFVLPRCESRNVHERDWAARKEANALELPRHGVRSQEVGRTRSAAGVEDRARGGEPQVGARVCGGVGSGM